MRAPSGVSAPEQLVDALYAFTDCEVTIASRLVVVRDNRPVEMTVSEVLRHQHRAARGHPLKRELELKEKKLEQDMHFKTLVRLFVEKRIYKAIEQARTSEAVVSAVEEGFRPYRRQMLRDPGARGHRYAAGHQNPPHFSYCDINQHLEEMEKVKSGHMEQTRQSLKNVTKYALAHLEALLEKYGPQYPRP